MLDTRQLMAEVREIISALKRGDYQTEVQISDYVVRRLFNGMGWPRFDAKLVYPQYPIGTRKVDFALCHPNGNPVVLVEVKRENKADQQATRQLFEYCFHQGVPIAVLTDGRTWKLFYPAGDGSYMQRIFFEMNLAEGNETAFVNGLTRYLAYDVVKSGKARKRAQDAYEESHWRHKTKERFPSVWNKLLIKPDSILVDLLEEAVVIASGVRPDKQLVIQFLRDQAGRTINTKDVTRVKPSKQIESDGKDLPTRVPKEHTPSFTLFGTTRICTSAKEVLVEIFSELARQDETFCIRLKERIPGRRRNFVARIREDLYPGYPDRIRAPVKIPGGWWIDTHSNNAQKKEWIKAACEVAGIRFGRDLIVYLSKDPAISLRL